MLACPVRGCALPLLDQGRTLSCASGHSFDRARSGYINLLQPQDRRSAQPGDSRQAVTARQRLHDKGLTSLMFNDLEAFLSPQPNEAILDVGCGVGFYLGSLASRHPLTAHGVDISIPAIEAAAKRYPANTWVVANADRALPWLDSSFDTVMSITARRNPSEFRRVLKPEGRLLLALPAPEDLIELRGTGRDRREQAIAEFAPTFTIRSQSRITHRVPLDASDIEDVRLAIYRPRGTNEAAALTFSLDLLLFELS